MPSFDETPICLSGGAEGADLQWGMVAGKAGHQVYHFIFAGHRSKAPKSELVTLTHDMLVAADPHLEIANKTLKRRWPVSNNWVAGLLRRNFYQIENAGSLYAVSTIGDDGLVEGGTSWAVQMMIDHHGKKGRVFVYDQKRQQWFRWEGLWVPIDSPPVPKGIWAGIGTRELNPYGKQAIRALLGYVSANNEVSGE